MNKIIYIAYVLFFIMASECFSQETTEEKSARKDTVQKLSEDSLLNKMNEREFLFNNFPLIYNSRYNASLDSILLNSRLNLNSIKVIPDPLTNFKKNMYAYLSFYYNSLPNYGLGLVGRYLLYFKKMAAIYLAILSLM